MDTITFIENYVTVNGNLIKLSSFQKQFIKRLDVSRSQRN